MNICKSSLLQANRFCLLLYHTGLNHRYHSEVALLWQRSLPWHSLPIHYVWTKSCLLAISGVIFLGSVHEVHFLCLWSKGELSEGQWLECSLPHRHPRCSWLTFLLRILAFLASRWLEMRHDAHSSCFFIHRQLVIEHVIQTPWRLLIILAACIFGIPHTLFLKLFQLLLELLPWSY